MSSLRSGLALGFGFVALAVGALWYALPVGTARTRGADIVMPRPLAGYRGAGSCAAASCHGGSGSIGTKGCEYSSWMAKDKHVRAYEVLLTERSRIIEKNYRGLATLAEAKPEGDLACLRCHATDAEAARRGERIARSDGVGCERCHGPAENWLTIHYQRDWAGRGEVDRKALGFWPTKDLAFRVKMCAECHVGAPGNEVDHDLIAAGHPRLSFENAAFLATMPPHWDIAAEKRRIPDLEARTWAIGQVATAAAALDLLAYRAGEKHKKPWPEFAEYDCFSCHHDLSAAGRTKPNQKAIPGTLPWSDWYYAVPTALAGERSPLASQAMADALSQLRDEMGPPVPDRAKVQQQASALARQFGERLPSIDRAPTWKPVTLRPWYNQLLLRDGYDFDANWDRATQSYLSLAALHNALTDLDPTQRDPATVTALKSMGKQLRFPRGQDSPRDLDTAALRKLREALRGE